eukprot:76794-Lingulodinium_polyedra.AAC.1
MHELPYAQGWPYRTNRGGPAVRTGVALVGPKLGAGAAVRTGVALVGPELGAAPAVPKQTFIPNGVCANRVGFWYAGT